MTIEKWNSFSEQYREGLINKWKKDIDRNKDYLRIAEELLKKRTN